MSETQDRSINTIIKSADISLLAGALAKAQGEMNTPAKKRTATVTMRAEKGGGTYTYKYADLSDIREAVTPALSKNELAVSQLIDADLHRLTTLLLHSSGQYLGSTYDLPDGLPVQQFGSALTYAKRYSLCSLLGVVAEDDDDGQLAEEYTQRQSKPSKAQSVIKPKSTQNVSAIPADPGMTRDEIMKKIVEVYTPFSNTHKEYDLAAHIYERYGVQSRTELNSNQAYELLTFMKNKINQGALA